MPTNDTAYCLSCEMWELVNVKGGGHLIFLSPPNSAYIVDVEYCYGPFVYSEPPAPLSEEDWQTVFEGQPTWEELMQMNAEVE